MIVANVQQARVRDKEALEPKTVRTNISGRSLIKYSKMKLDYQRKKRAVKWSHVLEASPQQTEERLPNTKTDDIVIVNHHHELK